MKILLMGKSVVPFVGREMEKLTVAYRIFRTHLKPVSSQERNVQRAVGNAPILVVLFCVIF